MKGKMKRTLARLLAVIMVVSMMPMTGFGATSSGAWKVGNTTYDALQTAVNNVPENGTIIMQGNGSENRSPIDAGGKSFTIDLSGNTLTNSSSVTWSDADGVTIKNGKLTGQMEVICVPSGSRIILENVTVNSTYKGNAITVESGGELQIVTGTFSATDESSAIQVETGGTITWGRQTAIPSEWKRAKTFTAELTTDFEATLDGVDYARLSEALADAQNGSEVVLLKDVIGADINDTGKSFTLNLNGKTVGSETASNVFIIDTSGSVLVKNGTVIGEEADYGVLTVEKGNVTIEDVSVRNLDKTTYAVYNEAGTINIKSGSFESANSSEGAIFTDAGGTTTVDTGSIVEPADWETASCFTATYDPIVEVRDSETATTGTKYADIETAIDEGAGKYLYLLKDMSEVKEFTLNEPTTFNLNGYTLTMKAGAYINIFDPITLKNGTIKLLDKDSTGGIYIQPSNNTDIINFDDVKVLSELSVLAVVASGNLVLGAGDYEASEGIKTGFEVYESATLTIKDGYATDLPEEEWTAFSSMHIGTSIEGDKYVISGLEESYIYKGKPVTPAITVKSVTTDRPLAAQQYNVVFSDNDKLGKAKGTIIGKNNFGGKLEANFNLLPCAVDSITVTPAATAPDSALTVSWTHPQAEQVNVYKVELYDGYDKLKEITTSAMSTTFSELTVDKEYKFVITPAVTIDSISVYGQNCDPAFGATVAPITPPTGLKGVNVDTTGKPKLTWDAVEGANKYELWMSTGGDYRKIGTTTGTTITHNSAESGSLYYYKIRAVGDAGITSDFCERVYIRCKYAKPVIKISNNENSGKPVISWNKVDGATKYELWMSTGGTYSKIGTTSGTSISHNSAKTGTLYYYKIKAAGSQESATSAFSDRLYIRCKYAKPVIKVSNNENSGKPVISWNKVDGATKYELWMSTGGTYSKIGTTSGISISHNSAKAGTLYYYKIKAAGSQESATSAFSDRLYIRCKYAKPVIKVTTTSAGKPVISWTKVSGASKYELWMSTGGTYSKIGTTSGTSITHNSAKAGTLYYYKVKAVGNTDTAASAFSDRLYIRAR